MEYSVVKSGTCAINIGLLQCTSNYAHSGWEIVEERCPQHHLHPCARPFGGRPAILAERIGEEIAHCRKSKVAT
eukprot:6491959-Amphidinium_carterae.2